jgi:hypothetical protein
MPGCAIDKTFSNEHETGSLTSPYNSQYLGTNFNNIERVDKLASSGSFQENNENLRSNFEGRKSDNKKYMSKDSDLNKSNNKELDTISNKNKFDNYLDEKTGQCSGNLFEKKEKCSDESISSESESLKNIGDTNSKTQITDIGISTTANSNNMNTIDSFSRDQDIRYTNLNDSNPASTSRETPYSVENIANRNNNEYEVQTVHSTSHRPYDPGTGVSNAQTAFERYEPNYLSQRQNLYSSYGQSSMGDINSSSKYLLDSQPHSQSQQLMNSVMKVEHDENTGPLYPRPMYQYDPTCTSIPSGFSAMNLSVKITSAQLPYKVSSSTPSPTSTNNGTGNSNAPVIDLSTNSITSTSSNGFENNNYSGRQNRSSPNTNSHIPSPQGQTLDLSVSRIPQRYNICYLVLKLVTYLIQIKIYSSSNESPYHSHSDSTTTTTSALTNGFATRSPQTEPVDFSGPPRHLGFGLIGANLPTAPYSRESTPDSGGTHYIENYRDPSGEF